MAYTQVGICDTYRYRYSDRGPCRDTVLQENRNLYTYVE